MSMDGDDQLPLGRHTNYPASYDPSCLYPIARSSSREAQGIRGVLPFSGEDIWQAWELSWLNRRGMPQVACGRFIFSAASPNIIESKSLKLYLNSLNQSPFDSRENLQQVLQRDLEAVSGVAVKVSIFDPQEWGAQLQPGDFAGDCIDALDIDISAYIPDANLLSLLASEQVIEERLFSRLFRSRCPVTGQPDWATLAIHYRGRALDREALLRYLVSYREHDGFHEDCVERIYCDLREHCRPEFLEVQARFLRRGGLDISPLRSSDESSGEFRRDYRQ